MTMPKLENDGTFQVRVIDAFIKEPGFGYHNNEENKKNDPNAFALVLKLETADGLTAFHQMEYTKKVITKGKSIGKSDAEASTAKLEELGISDGYLGNLKKMLIEGKTIECSVKMQWRDFQKPDGTTGRVCEAKYLNPPRTERNIKDIDFDAIFGKSVGSAPLPVVASDTSMVNAVTVTSEQINEQLDNAIEPEVMDDDPDELIPF